MHPLIYGFILGFVTVFVATLTTLLLLRKQSSDKRACVVVLGDIGRSPRMQYHCLSLVKHGFTVDFIGYGGSIPHSDIAQNVKIKCHHLWEPPALLQKFPKLLIYMLKTLWQIMTLTFVSCKVPTPSHILLQNPPAIPTLFVLSLIATIRGSHLVVDWHNYGYTILGLALGDGHPLVRFSCWYEGFFGSIAASNICVTKAMKEDLKNKWQICASTVYDRPPALFKETDLNTKHDLFVRLADKYDVFKPRISSEGATSTTCFTQRDTDGSTCLLEDRPALVISSTSWTEDEDFSILLEALEKYEADAGNSSLKFPNIICVITGKGPQKAYYQQLIQEKKMQHIEFCLPWLEAEDYPKLLGSADLGVCLHRSSSGLDLPMKVVDMFGCGLPVCAIHFNCLEELVKHKENGMVFKDSEELCSQLQELLRDFPSDQQQLKTLRQNLRGFQASRWAENWDKTVAPLFS